MGQHGSCPIFLHTWSLSKACQRAPDVCNGLHLPAGSSVCPGAGGGHCFVTPEKPFISLSLPAPLPPHSSITTTFLKPAGFAAAGYVALTGDLPGALASFKANYPILMFPTKLIITFPLVYHYLGGMRHFVWDLYKIGNQAEKTSLLETPRVEESSKILLGASAALSFVLAIL